MIKSGTGSTMREVYGCVREMRVREWWCVVAYGPQGHSDVVRSVAYSPDGRQLLSGSDDKTVRVWDVATGQCTATLQVSLHHIQ